MNNIANEASVFYFEKRVAEKLHKPKRKETITEILRFSVRQLDRLKHPKLLTLYHPIEESNDALAFATEPVLGTLANVLGSLEERLPQNLPPIVKEYTFLDLEIKYGLLQLTEALCFLHYSCKLIHRNLCPQSVIINKRGTWKLAGLEFAEKCNENDIMWVEVLNEKCRNKRRLYYILNTICSSDMTCNHTCGKMEDFSL
ncbi:SCY1-like protein 2 [Caerostris darwini]|uniref:SCY1-like protein 2 n=1 Tax=Caerostris darwini TaxID=1538125 RepID=A0AAV4VW20_9ARAC|nr:SCY1-like protein 2 [Caerostris darwini]